MKVNLKFLFLLLNKVEEEKEKQKDKRKKEREKILAKKRNMEGLLSDAQKRNEAFSKKVGSYLNLPTYITLILFSFLIKLFNVCPLFSSDGAVEVKIF